MKIFENVKELLKGKDLMQSPEVPIADDKMNSANIGNAYGDQQKVMMSAQKLTKAINEMGTSLWYLKTRFFKKDWDDQISSSDDPRERRAIGKINKCIDSLLDAGIEIVDPVNKRYPKGSEATMNPLQFIPTEGITAEMVTETFTPIVFVNNKILQRGEVFVAVPKGLTETATETTEDKETIETVKDKETTDTQVVTKKDGK